MKRILSLVLALSMVLSMFTFAFAGTTLKDITGTEYEAAVSALVELGIVNGYNDGTYQPKKVVSRAEMAKLLVISVGLEPAAEVAKGVTNFSDVDKDHWATGYINVAAQYGYINGYPDGTFRPDATVTYAEAVTMAIRVLGYKTVVEAKGTWPTNYIAKAQELKVLKDVKYSTYADGAMRGNVALIVWNMLRTNMWDVTSENENDGLTYGKTGATMIDKYFEDYEYIDEDAEAVVTAIDVKDGKVKVDVENDKKGDEKISLSGVELAADVDFLKVFGRTVSVLRNKDTEEIVLLTPSTNDSVVEGYMYDLDKKTTVDVKTKGDYNFEDAKEFTWGDGRADNKHSYAVAVLGTKKNVDYVTYFTIKNEGIVDEVKTKNDETTVKFLEGVKSIKLDDDAIVMINGVAMTAEDIKAGDVLTELVKDELYVASRDVVTGSFKDIESEEIAKGDDRYFLTIDKDEYEHVVTDHVVELDEDGEDKAETDLSDIQAAKKDDDAYKFFDEDAKLYLNFLGEVVRVEFNEIESKETVGHFYVLTNKKATWEVNDKSGSTTYVELNGESYEIKNGVDVDDLKAGEVVFVKFDSKDRVKEITQVSKDSLSSVTVDGYKFELAKNAEGILDDKNYIGDHKVNSNTTVMKVTPVYDEDDDSIIDHYKVEATKGTSALKGIEEGIVAWEDDDTFEKATYVFVWKDAKSDETYGLVEKYNYSKGTEYLTIDGTRYEVDEDQADAKDFLGQLVSFVINEDDNTITIKKHYATSELNKAGFVTKVEDRVATVSGDGFQSELVFDLDVFEDEMDDDCKVILAEVSENKDGDYEFDSWEEVSIKDLKLKKDDRLATSPAGIKSKDDYKKVEVLVITRGYDKD